MTKAEIGVTQLQARNSKNYQQTAKRKGRFQKEHGPIDTLFGLLGFRIVR